MLSGSRCKVHNTAAGGGQARREESTRRAKRMLASKYDKNQLASSILMAGGDKSKQGIMYLPNVGPNIGGQFHGNVDGMISIL